MKRIKAALIAAFAITTVGAVASPGKAAPLPTNVAAMKAALDKPVLQVRYGGWRGGGWGRGGWGGYRGWGYGGHRGWGLGAVAAGAVVGGAIASSSYYGGYPYYGGRYPYYGDSYAYDDSNAYDDSYAYGGGYASENCSPYGYGDHYSHYGARRYYPGW